jgi:hypothetical protein
LCEPAAARLLAESTDLGTFKTVQYGVYSFKFMFGSCMFTGSNLPFIDRLISEPDADLFVMMGDLHYEDINVDNVAVRNKSYADVFKSDRQRSMYRRRATAYVWDDHDFGVNNADGNSRGKPASRCVCVCRLPSPLLSAPYPRSFSSVAVLFSFSSASCVSLPLPCLPPSSLLTTCLSRCAPFHCAPRLLPAHAV